MINKRTSSDMFSKSERSRIMRAVKSTKTKPEELFSAAIEPLDLEFTRNPVEIPGKPDFYFASIGVAVFIHGCFWHGHDKCRRGIVRPKANAEFWNAKIEKNKRRDRRVVRLLRKRGIAVYTVWECRFRGKTPPKRVINRLLNRSGRSSCEADPDRGDSS